MTVAASLSTPVSCRLIDLDSIFLTMKVLVIAKINAKKKEEKYTVQNTGKPWNIVYLYNYNFTGPLDSKDLRTSAKP